MMNSASSRKLAFFLPNIFTALNMACGFTAIIMATRGQFYQAGMILILGGIFDSVDGRVARMTGTQSAFGEQFDSLSDVISFGMAPAVIFYFKFFPNLGRVGLVVSFFYLLCGALRLARFNANIDKVSSAYFQGLPIPGAALALVGYVFFAVEYPILREYTILAVVYMLFYSILMISSVPFNSFKNSKWVKSHKKYSLVLIFILIALTFLYEQLMLGVIISTYVVGSLIYFSTHKDALSNIFEWKSDTDSDTEGE
jgi:CDP-diacylglycerol--serine O-phosphatidyltransferase